MSNLANYSPYNKTYKFLLFQNQAYHEKNKINAKPCVRTNLRYEKSLNQSYYNPELSQSEFFNKSSTDQWNRCQSPANSVNRSMLFSSRSLRQSNPQLQKEKRVVHKNASFEKFNNWRIDKANKKLVNRLISTSCQVIKRQKSEKSFKNHLRYRQIRNKYDPAGQRKHALALGKQDLLCPTLKQYNESGLAEKFIQSDLSWFKNSSTRTTLRKKNSNFSCN